MNVTLTSLEALILKATHESLPCPDAAALEAFCAVMRDAADGFQLAAQALAARIHSTNPREAMLALSMLDRCMRRCDSNFHAEIGKFRFLNEMIKLVSPKYLADRTSPEVRTRVIQLLHAWCIEYPKESKFKVAYDMLKNQGVVKETPPPLPPEEQPPQQVKRNKSSIFEDEAKSKLLQKLLQSKKPEDIQHANRLIKTMVKEEERRNEVSSRRAQEVSTALDSAGLLRDMLECSENASKDEEQLIHELHAICLRMRPALQLLAASEAHPEDLDEILTANDLIDEAYQKYEKFIEGQKAKESNIGSQQNSDSLLDFAGSNPVSEQPKISGNKNSIDELGDIFGNEGSSSSIAQPLVPVSLLPSEDVDLLSDKSKKEGWNELDSLGEQLMKQSLPDNAKRIDSFNSKTKKIPMKELTSPKRDTQNGTNTILDLDFFTKQREQEPKSTPQPIQTQDDLIVDITETPTNNNNILDIPMDKPENSPKVDKNKDVKPLTDINVALDSIEPSKVPPLTAFEDDSGVTVVLHFCKDKPRADVNVIVVSTTSRNKSPIDEYKFQAVVPKGYKVRLLKASGTSLPAYNPFLPPPALTQVMLIARPSSAPAPSLKFVITYSSDDDMYSEIGEVTQLPLDDI